MESQKTTESSQKDRQFISSHTEMLTPSELESLKKGCKEFSKYFDEKWDEDLKHKPKAKHR